MCCMVTAIANSTPGSPRVPTGNHNTLKGPPPSPHTHTCARKEPERKCLLLCCIARSSSSKIISIYIHYFFVSVSQFLVTFSFPPTFRGVHAQLAHPNVWPLPMSRVSLCPLWQFPQLPLPHSAINLLLLLVVQLKLVYWFLTLREDKVENRDGFHIYYLMEFLLLERLWIFCHWTSAKESGGQSNSCNPQELSTQWINVHSTMQQKRLRSWSILRM